MGDRAQLKVISQKIRKELIPLYLKPSKVEMEDIDRWMKTKMNSPSRAVDLSKTIFDKYGHEGYAALTQEVFFSNESISRSLLSSEPRYQTVIVRDVNISVLQVVKRVENILNYPANRSMITGRVEFFRDETLTTCAIIDLPDRVVELLKDKKSKGDDVYQMDTIEIPTEEIPERVFTHNINQRGHNPNQRGHNQSYYQGHNRHRQHSGGYGQYNNHDEETKKWWEAL